MFRKIRILLWKEAVYRLKILTFIPMVLILLIGLVTNIVREILVEKIDTSYEPEIFTPDQASCTIIHNLTILAYEPSNPFARKIMEEVVCSNVQSKNQSKAL